MRQLFSLLALATLPFPALHVSATVPEPAPIMGWYELGSVEPADGDGVRVELRLRLFCRGPEPIEGARLVLEGSLPHLGTLGTLTGVTIAVQASTDRAESLLLPREEYELWRRGAMPKLRLVNSEGVGNRGWIPLVARPLAGTP